jgi:hypothetical protein
MIDKRFAFVFVAAGRVTFALATVRLAGLLAAARVAVFDFVVVLAF